ncbi:hypothetical protein BH23BAC1_BH23BAC1_45520 [soil metagenome]
MKNIIKTSKYIILILHAVLLLIIITGCAHTITKIIPGPAEFPVRVVSLQELPDGYFWEYGLTDQRGVYYNHICYPDAHYIGDSVRYYHIEVNEDLVYNYNQPR